MDVVGTGEAFIRRPARDVLELALDPTRYALADRKIGPVESYERHGNRGEMRVRARLFGLVTPPIPMRFVLTPFRQLDLWTTQLPFVRFRARFTCTETPGGTWVKHEERLGLPFFLGLVVRPFAGALLDVPGEVSRLERLLEAEWTLEEVV